MNCLGAWWSISEVRNRLDPSLRPAMQSAALLGDAVSVHEVVIAH